MRAWSTRTRRAKSTEPFSAGLVMLLCLYLWSVNSSENLTRECVH
jgi:hypothetical protein